MPKEPYPFSDFLTRRLKHFSKKDLVQRILLNPNCRESKSMVQSRSREALEVWAAELESKFQEEQREGVKCSGEV